MNPSDVSEKRRAEQALRRQSEQLQEQARLLDLAQVLIRDVDGHILLWNTGAAQLYGFTAAEAEGQVSHTLLHTEFPQPLEEVNATLLREGRWQGELVHRRKDGSRLVVVSLWALHRGQDGEAARVIEVNNDITFQKQAEEKLREGQRRFHAVFNQQFQFMAILAPDGTVLEANDTCFRATGVARERTLGHLFWETPWWDRLPTMQERWKRSIAEALRTGGPVTGEVDYSMADGSVRHATTVVTGLKDDAGHVTTLIVEGKDDTDRKRTEESMRESEQRFARFMQHLPGLAWIKDLQGRYIYVNDATLTAFRRTSDGLIGKTDEEIFPPATAAQFQQNDRSALASEAGVQVIETLEHEDGIVHHSVVTKFPILGPEGRPALVGGMAMDITDRLQNERVLAESEERFRQLAENITEVFWMTDLPTTQMLYISPAYERVWGRSCRSLSENPWSFMDAIHPEDQERVRLAVLNQSRGEQTDKEYRVVRPDGSIRWVRDRAFPVKNVAGQFYRQVGIVDDFTEKKHSEETIRSLLRISERLNSTLDTEELLDLLVQEAVRLVGAESGVSGLRHPEGMVCHKYFQRGQPLPLNYCWPPMHGLPGWLLVHKIPYQTNDALTDTQIVHELCVQFGVRSALSIPILNARGELLGFFEIHNKEGGFTSADQQTLLAVSHTASMAIQNALAYRRIRQAEESLREADRRKDFFMATLAHELRNPLAPIRNGLELLRRADGDSQLREQARSLMERQLQRMVRLVDDLLDVSRITRGKVQLRKERVELKTVLDSAIEAARPIVEGQGHQLTVSLPGQPIAIDGDPARLAQVFANLLDNAAKYTDKGGHIWLTVERQDAEVVVCVRDTGIGIPAEQLPYLFEMFAQLKPALERSQGGLGIGLALVHGLVELHEGRVEARSAGSGQGSEFLVYLPVAEAQAQPTTEADTSANEGRCSPKRRILVADDNVDGCESLALILRLMGHDIQTAYDGLEAVQAAAAFRPDLAILDIGMPKKNGYEVARYIRAQSWGKQVVLVALTGWGQKDDKRQATDAGFDHHLTKPAQPADLEKLLSSSVGRPS
jgi:PAS domain S-box-containing protein